MSLDDIRAREQKASDELGRICADNPERPWRISIPANPERDSDLILADALADNVKMAAALDAVLAVHVEGTFQRLEPQQECKHCRYAWPCVTVRAITEALR